MHLGRIVNSNDLLPEQVNEVERESNVFGGCSPMQSGRVLYRKNMWVTAKQSWYNRTKRNIIDGETAYSVHCIGWTEKGFIFYVRNYWIYRAS